MMLNKNEINLDRYARRKSLYGKAGARDIGGGVYVLRSYYTEEYAAAYNGYLVILSEQFTATSATHLEAFAGFSGCVYHGKNGNGKRDPFNWYNLPRVEGAAYMTEADLAAAVKASVEERQNEGAAA